MQKKVMLLAEDNPSDVGLTKRQPVVILTSSREEQDVAMTYELGANSYIRQPIDCQQFAEAVRASDLHWVVLNEPPPLK